MTASAIYHFLCCVDLTSEMLLNNNINSNNNSNSNNNNNNNNNSNNNNNNNNNENNNNKDLFASSIFTMALRAIEKKL